MPPGITASARSRRFRSRLLLRSIVRSLIVVQLRLRGRSAVYRGVACAAPGGEAAILNRRKRRKAQKAGGGPAFQRSLRLLRLEGGLRPGSSFARSAGVGG